MKTKKRIAKVWAIALVAMGIVGMTVGAANAQVTITFVGSQLNFEAKTDDPTVGWRNAATAKTYDIDGDNVFGTDGYEIFNSLGNIVSLPTYVNSVTKMSPKSYSGQGVMDAPADPSGSDTLAYGMYYHQGQADTAMFSFALTKAGGALGGVSTIRVTVFQDAYNAAWGAGGQQLRLTGPGGAMASSGSVDLNRGDYLDAITFDITGFADGDVYTLYAAITSGPYYSHAVGVVFDSEAIPGGTVISIR